MDEKGKEKKDVNLYAMSTNKWNAYCKCMLGEEERGGWWYRRSALNTHEISAIKIL